jgi:hypothetical protein
MGPSAYIGIAEIMSGRSCEQQGLAATCEDLLHMQRKKNEVVGLAHEPV